MDLKELQKNWNKFGETDPFWSILTEPNKKMNKWCPEEFFKRGEIEIDAVMKYAKSVYGNFANKRALDFGCGVGRLTQALTNYFDEVYGIDIAPSMIKLANKYNKFGKKCNYVLNKSDDLRLFEDNSFDFIYSNIVLQHMKPEYSKNYIKEFIRILAPKGVIIFQIPSNVKNVAQSLPDSAFKAKIEIKNPSLKMEIGSQMNICVAVKNISDTIWPSLGDVGGNYFIKLGNHWLDNDGNIYINDDARSILPRDIKSQEEIELNLVVTAPKKSGIYILECDMVQEGVSWFKNKGSETARTNVIISAMDRKKSYKPVISKLKLLMEKIYPKITPKMEMYSVRKLEILNLIEKNGGRLIDAQEDGSAGKEWISYRYCITK